MAVAKLQMPAWTRRPGVLAAIVLLHYGMMWVAFAGCVAKVIERRAFGEVEGSTVLSAASSVFLYSVTVAVSTHLVAGMLICERGRWAVAKDSKKVVPRKFLSMPLNI